MELMRKENKMKVILRVNKGMHDTHLTPTIVMFGHSLWAADIGLTARSFGIMWLNLAIFIHIKYSWS